MHLHRRPLRFLLPAYEIAEFLPPGSEGNSFPLPKLLFPQMPAAPSILEIQPPSDWPTHQPIDKEAVFSIPEMYNNNEPLYARCDESHIRLLYFQAFVHPLW